MIYALCYKHILQYINNKYINITVWTHFAKCQPFSKYPNSCNWQLPLQSAWINSLDHLKYTYILYLHAFILFRANAILFWTFCHVFSHNNRLSNATISSFVVSNFESYEFESNRSNISDASAFPSTFVAFLADTSICLNAVWELCVYDEAFQPTIYKYV
jgi:hypothetical protein